MNIEIGSRWRNRYTRERFLVTDIEVVPFRGYNITTDVIVVLNTDTDEDGRWDISFFKQAFDPLEEEE